MDTLDFGYFFRQLKAGASIDETCFYFTDDPQGSEHYIGYLPQYEKPYWVGYCDIPDGCEYQTAEELVEAKIYDGKSLKERWSNVRIVRIAGISLDYWIQMKSQNETVQKNKASWNDGAEVYSKFNHSDKLMSRVLQNPENAFHHTTWDLISRFVPDLNGKRICVPSSGDNHAVFAFAMLGAKVTSCDISENQLANAERIAKQYGWDKSIEFICQDTMKLDGIASEAYDFVYTSNGVHVWINDLNSMYRSIRRIMKPGAVYIMYEIHPFLRPFDDDLKIEKPYDRTGPFESDTEVTFAWRVMDIMNAMLDSGLAVKHIEEMFAEKDYNWPFWLPYSEIAKGATATPEEVDRMHDWRINPMAALPNWISIAAVRE